MRHAEENIDSDGMIRPLWVLSASTTSYSTARESGAEFSLAAYLAKVAELAEKFESDMVDIASSDLLRRYYKNDYCNELQL